MRHLSLVGVVRNARVIDLARQCAWCRRWRSQSDYVAAHRYNAKVSHGICKACAAKFEAQMNELPMGPDGGRAA